MELIGKGFFIWQVRHCEGGDPNAIAERAAAAGLSHVLVKIADTNKPSNIWQGQDLAKTLVRALRDRHIQAWGWHYVKGNEPQAEAELAVQRTRLLRLDGYVIDAEQEYKASGKDAAARQFMQVLRTGLPNTPIALSSFRYPRYHRLPWRAFLERCDYAMPQVYWEQAHNPGDQLRRSLAEYQDLELVGVRRPVVPTAAAYGTLPHWVPTAADLQDFFQTAQSSGLSAANAYSWDWATSGAYRYLFDTVAQFPWPTAIPPTDEVELPSQPDALPPTSAADLLKRYLRALNEQNIPALLSLYQPNAGHVTARRIVIGTAALQGWYQELLHTDLPNASFNVGDLQGLGNAWTFRWTCNSTAGQILNGFDTLGLRDGLIQYHHTSYIIS
jgi:hypothetical protein